VQILPHYVGATLAVARLFGDDFMLRTAARAVPTVVAHPVGRGTSARRGISLQFTSPPLKGSLKRAIALFESRFG